MSDWTICEECPHNDLCRGSKWNCGSHGRPSPEPEGDDLTLTDAHTCFTCGNKVLTDYRRHTGDRLIIPDGCPRWDAVSCSGIDCSGCNAEREDLKNAHPNAALHQAAVGKMMDLLTSTITRAVNKEPVDELARRRQVEDASGAMVSADDPTHWIGEFLEEYPEAAGRAEVLIGAVVSSILNDPQVVPEWAKHQDWQHAMFLMKWSEACLLAVQRHDDADAAAWEVWLTVLDNPAIRRAWFRMTTPKKLLVRRGWAEELRGFDSSETG